MKLLCFLKSLVCNKQLETTISAVNMVYVYTLYGKEAEKSTMKDVSKSLVAHGWEHVAINLWRKSVGSEADLNHAMRQAYTINDRFVRLVVTFKIWRVHEE